MGVGGVNVWAQEEQRFEGFLQARGLFPFEGVLPGRLRPLDLLRDVRPYHDIGDEFDEHLSDICSGYLETFRQHDIGEVV